MTARIILDLLLAPAAITSKEGMPIARIERDKAKPRAKAIPDLKQVNLPGPFVTTILSISEKDRFPFFRTLFIKSCVTY